MESNTSHAIESQAESQISYEKRREIEREADRCAYNGGRALNAVFYSDMSPPEKLIMLFLGSEMDFTGEFSEYIPITRSILAKRLGYQKASSVDPHIKRLEDRGYITVTKKLDHRGVWDPNGHDFAITKKFFEDYSDWLARQAIDHGMSPKSSNYKRNKTYVELGSSGKRTRGSAKIGLGVVRKTDPFYSDRTPPKTPLQNKTPAEFQEPVPEPIPEVSSTPQKPEPTARKTRSGVLKVTKSSLYGELGQLYETTTKRDVIRATVEEMLALSGNDRELVLRVIRKEKEIPREHLLSWGPNHSFAWRDRVETLKLSPACAKNTLES